MHTQDHLNEEEQLKQTEQTPDSNSEADNRPQADTQTQTAPENQENTDAREQNDEQELSPEQLLTQQLEEAQRTIEEQKDKFLRLSAEFDNYRKRTLKEKAELIRNGGEKTITAILPILDDLERALQNMQTADNVEAICQGIELIAQKFHKQLAQEGLEKMEPVGQDFDTDFHEAVALVPAPEDGQKGKVLDCVQTGYRLHDKVIRHAKVVVAQ